MLYKFLTSIILLVSSLVTILILPRSVGIQIYGEYSYVLAFFTLVFQMLLLNVNTAYIYLSEKGNHLLSELNGFYIFYSILIIFVVGIFTYFSASWYIFEIWNGIDNKLLIFGLLAFSSVTFIIQRLSEVADVHSATKYVEISKSVGKVLFTASFVFLFLNQKLTVYTAIMANVSTTLIAAFIVFYKLRSIVELGYFNRHIVKKVFNYSAPLMGFMVVSSFWMMLTRYLLLLDNGTIETGYFSLAHSLVLLPVGVMSSFVTLLLKRLMQSQSRGQCFIKLCQELESNWGMIFFFICTASIFLFVFADELIFNFVGAEFAGSSHPLRILSIFCFMNFFGMISANIFFTLGLNRDYLRINLFVTLISLLIVECVHHFIGIDSVRMAWLLLLTYVLRVSWQIYYMKVKLVSINIYKWGAAFTLIFISFSLLATTLKLISLNIYLCLCIYGTFFFLIGWYLKSIGIINLK